MSVIEVRGLAKRFGPVLAVLEAASFYPGRTARTTVARDVS